MKILKRHLKKNVPDNNPHINKVKNWGEPGDFYLGNFLSRPKAANAVTRDQEGLLSRTGTRSQVKVRTKKASPQSRQEPDFTGEI